MRGLADKERVRRLLEEMGRRATGPGRVYLVGGGTAVTLGWRETTKDVDIKLDPEPAGVFEAIRDLKQELDMNVELAAPDQFVPALPQWRERSEPIGKFGPVEFLHYDFYGQALAKLVRGHEQDLTDVRELVALGKVVPQRLVELLGEVRDQLIRYPRLDPDDVWDRVVDWAGGHS